MLNWAYVSRGNPPSKMSGLQPALQRQAIVGSSGRPHGQADPSDHAPGGQKKPHQTHGRAEGAGHTRGLFFGWGTRAALCLLGLVGGGRGSPGSFGRNRLSSPRPAKRWRVRLDMRPANCGSGFARPAMQLVRPAPLMHLLWTET